MSNIQKLALLDPRLEVSETFKNFYVMLGSPDILCQPYPATSFSNSNINFNITLPDNHRCVIDRSSAILSIPIRITMNGTGAGVGNIYQPDREGLRSNPFDKMVLTSNYNINGSSLSYQNSEQILPMERYDDNLSNNQISPTMCDCSQNYTSVYGTNRSPFALFFDNPNEITRRAYPITVISNNTTDAVIDLVLYINIFDYPPFTEQNDVVGVNITPFTILYTMVSQLSRIWSRDPAHTQNLTTLNVTVGTNSLFGQPQISMIVLSLPHSVEIPDNISYPYNQVSFYPSVSSGSIAPNTTINQHATSVIQLDTLPSKIYIYVKASTQHVLSSMANSIGIPDTFASIIGVHLTLGNKNRLLASYSVQDLYNMSKKNGLSNKWSFSDFSGRNGPSDPTLMGSVICIDPSKDLSLAPGTIVGLSNKLNFQAFVSYTTISPYTMPYDVNVFIIYDGIQTMIGNRCDFSTNIISSEAELQMSPMSYNEIKAVYGGVIAGRNAKSFFKNMWGKLKEVAGPINKLLKSTGIISKATSFIPGVGPVVSGVAKTLGYGEGGNFYTQNMDGGQYYNQRQITDGGFIAGEGAPSGGILAGGRTLQRRDLARNVRRY